MFNDIYGEHYSTASISRMIDTEAFYVMLAVKEDKTREVIGIYNKPIESAQGWGEMLNDIYERGVQKVGLICADGLKGLEDVISEDLWEASSKNRP